MMPTTLVATWTDGLFAISANGYTQEIVDQPVRGLSHDGRGGALAIVGRHSLRRREQSGEWATIAASEFELSCCAAVGDAIYVGTDDARMLRLQPGDAHMPGALELLNAFETVPGRETWFAGSAIVNGQRMGPPLGIRSIAGNSDASILYANVHVGGIPRSRDDGRTWEPTIDINSDVHEVCTHHTNPAIVVAASAVGLCISRDSGSTWTIEDDGLHATHCSAVAFSGDDIFISASTSPFATEGRIYRRPLHPDGPLVTVEGGMPEWTEGSADTGCIATSGALIAVVDRGGNLYNSEDFGRTWSRQSTGLPNASGVVIF